MSLLGRIVTEAEEEHIIRENMGDLIMLGRKILVNHMEGVREDLSPTPLLLIS